MGIEVILIALGIVLFGGMFLACYFSYHEKITVQAEVSVATVAEAEKTPAFYVGPTSTEVMPVDMLVRQIEHHLRRELIVANLFVDDPSAQTLWMGIQPVQEAC